MSDVAHRKMKVLIDSAEKDTFTVLSWLGKLCCVSSFVRLASNIFFCHRSLLELPMGMGHVGLGLLEISVGCSMAQHVDHEERTRVELRVHFTIIVTTWPIAGYVRHVT